MDIAGAPTSRSASTAEDTIETRSRARSVVKGKTETTKPLFMVVTIGVRMTGRNPLAACVIGIANGD